MYIVLPSVLFLHLFLALQSGGEGGDFRVVPFAVRVVVVAVQVIALLRAVPGEVRSAVIGAVAALVHAVLMPASLADTG
jgi:hypothetical protein